jgi:endoglucanase
MKIKKLNFTILLFLVHVTLFVQAQTFDFGVNLAGAEFGEDSMPGTFGTHYIYPNEEELDYYQSKNLKLIRLPFRWERIQQTLSGNLDTDELNRLKDFVQLATTRNMYVLLDLHNSARYLLGGEEFIIGTEDVSNNDIKDLWTRLANEFKDETNIWGYGIMNEPHDMFDNTHWFDIAQEIIDGIRTVDTQTTIVVGGDRWSSAEFWVEYSDNLKDLVDPSNKMIYEAHVYFDDDASGQYLMSYDDEGATPNTGVNRVQPFVDWLAENNLRGFIGEYGVPDNDSRWLTTLDNFLDHLKSNCLNGTYWAGGPWWGTNFMAIDPVGKDGESDPVNGEERPQMSIVENYTIADSDCPNVLSNGDFSDVEQVIVSPNPFQEQFTISYTNENYSIKIFNSLGQEVASYKDINNTKTIELKTLKTGIYFVQVISDNNDLKTFKVIKR